MVRPKEVGESYTALEIIVDLHHNMLKVEVSGAVANTGELLTYKTAENKGQKYAWFYGVEHKRLENHVSDEWLRAVESTFKDDMEELGYEILKEEPEWYNERW